MSRFDEGDWEDAVPFDLWEQTVSRALGSRRGQEALAEMEQALVDLPEPVLIEGHLAAGGRVCAVGALVARREAAVAGADVQTIIDRLGVACDCGHQLDAHRDGGPCTATRTRRGETRPCSCPGYMAYAEDASDTVAAGQRAGLKFAVAYHFAYLNDEKYADLSPEDRHAHMLAWVRRAQGKAA